MRPLFLIFIGLIALTCCNRSNYTVSSADPYANFTTYADVTSIIKGIDSDSIPYVYVNGEWYPWFGTRSLSDYPYDSIIDMTVRNDEYGNRAIFVKYPKCIVDSIKNTQLDYFINSDPTVIFDNGNGNPASMMRWIKGNKRIPTGYQGKAAAVVMYEVNPYGSVANVRLFKGSGNEEIDQDAVRLVKNFPRFKVIYYTPWRRPVRQTIRLIYHNSDTTK